MKRHFLSVCAALFALTVLCSVTTYAADNVYAILYNDGTLTFQYGNTPKSGKDVSKTYEVDLNAVYTGSYNVPWHNEWESVNVLNFADKISPTATAYWFNDCMNLEYVDNIQNLDTTNVISMRSMFSGCSGLTALDVSGFDTANVTDMSGMFNDCSGLTALDVSHFDTANVTSMGDDRNTGMFSGCSGLTALDLSSFDTKNVTSMSCMFWACSGLTALDLSHFDTANVTSMWGMFSGCSGLKALDLSRFDTANVTGMFGMFSACSGLKALDLSRFDTANVTGMSCMFEGCSGLTALDLSSFDTTKVKGMEYMFYGCSNLKTIYASDKFTTASVPETEDENSRNMFYGCTSLVGGNGTNFNNSHTTNKRYARIDTASAPGYFTYKEAPAPVAYAITALMPQPDTGILLVKLTNPSSATVFVAYFDAKGQFLTADMKAVPANAGSVELKLLNVNRARVAMFDDQYRPLCDPYVSILGA